MAESHTPYTVFAFESRKPGMSLDLFRYYYENIHVPLFMMLVQPEEHMISYTRHYIQREEADRPELSQYDTSSADIMGYDAIVRTVFKSKAAMEAMLKKFAEVQDQILEDEKNFLDKSKEKVVFVEDFPSMKIV